MSDKAIEVKNVTFTYPNGFTALKNIDFEIGSNEFVAIIGQNGAGKSTLLKNITGLLRPTKGEVLISGKNTKYVSVAKLSTTIGFVLQNPDRQLFANTIEEEVSFGPRNLKLNEKEVQKRVEEALDFVDLRHLAQEYPPSLSKGERGKVVVASVIAMKPSILVLDEPTTGQDYKGCYQIMDIAKEFHKSGYTVVVVTHQMSLVTDYCERAIVFCDGEILLDGKTDEVFKQKEVLRTTFILPPQITVLGELLQTKLKTDHTFTKVAELGDKILEASH